MPRKGYRATKEHRDKNSAVHTNPSPETRAKISAALTGNKNFLGHKHNQATKAKIGAAQKGRKHNQATKDKMSTAKMGNKNFLGHKHNQATKDKMSTAHTNPSPETRARRRAALIGRKRTMETKRKMSVAASARMKKMPHLFMSRAATKVLDDCELALGVKIDREVHLHDPIFGVKVYDGVFGDTLIEVDGAYWHAKQKQKQNDHIKDLMAKVHGFSLIRIRI